ncbi:hypothetical protein [Phocaeicola sartorii]|uniref:hypothetical protein n=1 Tax=Phocaeicola sartorii TaxID=671267 RepID=UPI0013646D80|nr:hypothetical protein [Phocaeicola sartorii]
MKFLKDRILPLFMTALLGGLLPACVNEDEGTSTASDDGSFFISIAISAGNASPARAESDLTDEEGTSVENNINIGDLKIYAFSIPTDNNASNSALLTQIYPKDDNNSNIIEADVKKSVPGTYMLEAELNNTFFDNHKDFCLVAVANWTPFVSLDFSLPDGKELSVLGNEELLFGQNIDVNKQAWTPNGEEGIPMFGLHKASLAGYDKKHNNKFAPLLLGKVNMLRAFAKIEIRNGMKDKEITGVSISSYNKMGYFTPSLIGNQLSDTENVTSANIPNPVESSVEELSFSGKDGAFVAYLPEYELTNGKRDIITVTIDEKKYLLSLAPYTDDGPNEKPTEDYWKALLRNHIYRYIITGVEEDEPAQLTINYTVCPMNEVPPVDITFD